MAGEASEEVKEELEKKKQEKIDEKKKVEEKTTVDKDSKGSKHTNNEENKGKEIKKSDGILDSFSSIFEAISGTGRFEGDDSSLFNRLGKAFSKADNITQMLSGAGITMALMKLIDSTKEDDKEDASEEFSDEIKKNKRSLDEKLDKSYQESSSLAARITSAMQNQNIANNLAGSGVMIKSLAMISIKTQESLKSISEFLYKTSLAQSECLSNLSDSIEDISDSDGDLLQGMMPLLIGGLMVAFGSFFLGDKGKKGVVDNLIDRVVNSIINVVLGENANDSKNILKTFIDKTLEIFDADKKEITKSINNVTNLLSNDFWKNLSESLKNIEVDKINNFLNKIFELDLINLQNSFSDFTKFLTDNNETIKSISNLLNKIFPPENLPENNTGNTGFFSLLPPKAQEAIKSLENSSKTNVLKTIIDSLSKISNIIDVFLVPEKRKELINSVLDDVTSAIREMVKTIVEEIGKIKNEISSFDKIFLKISEVFNSDEDFKQDVVKIIKNKVKKVAEKDNKELIARNNIIPLTTTFNSNLQVTPPLPRNRNNSNGDDRIISIINDIHNNIQSQKGSIENLSENIGRLATGIREMPAPIVTPPEVNINTGDFLNPIKNSLGEIKSDISDIKQNLNTSSRY